MEINFGNSRSNNLIDITEFLVDKKQLKKEELQNKKLKKIQEKENDINEPNRFKKYSKIYKLESDKGPKIYIGSCYSTKYLSNRMGNHREGYKKYKNNKANFCSSYLLFDEYGMENCKITLIENFKCENKKELMGREGYYILQNRDICVNKSIPGRDKKEYYKDVKYFSQKIYYEKNKQKINSQKRIKDKEKYLLKKLESINKNENKE
jgi:hypothetical protein